MVGRSDRNTKVVGRGPLLIVMRKLVDCRRLGTHFQRLPLVCDDMVIGDGSDCHVQYDKSYSDLALVGSVSCTTIQDYSQKKLAYH